MSDAPQTADAASAAAAAPQRILVVDDTPLNVKMLADILTFKGYAVVTAGGGKEGLAKVQSEKPDLVLLDVMMPDMNGYDVCRALRADAATEHLPVVMVTALDPGKERANGLEAGADDFLAKPINQPELLARVRSLLRIKAYQDTVARQAEELKALNDSLAARVNEQVAQLDRLGRLKGFFSPQLAESILTGGGEDLLRTHRKDVTVVFLDLRGFTAFTDSAEPEEVMGVLGTYHRAMGEIILAHQGTVERFAGDGLMVFFNDPIPLTDPTGAAARMAIAMQERFRPLAATWTKEGYELELGIGFTHGYATLGAVGFEGRWDYACIGSVTNLAARLCGEAKGGEILTNQKTYARIESAVVGEPAGDLALKGLARPVAAIRIAGLR